MARFLIKLGIFLVFSNQLHSKEIDICEDNYSCKQTYLYNYLDFNLDNDIVKHRYKFSHKIQKKFQSYYEIERKFKIVKIDEDGITFEQTFKNHFKSQHNMYLDDKYLIGSSFYKRKYGKQVNESGGIESPWYRVKIFPKKKLIEETYWPLTKNSKSNIINLVISERQFKEEKQKKKIAKIIVFVATVYLYSKALDKVKTANSSAKNVKKSNSALNNKGNTYNPYTPEWAKPNKFTPSWALPPAQKANRLSSYLLGRRLFP